jgi:hypothetical protein
MAIWEMILWPDERGNKTILVGPIGSRLGHGFFLGFTKNLGESGNFWKDEDSWVKLFGEWRQIRQLLAQNWPVFWQKLALLLNRNVENNNIYSLAEFRML